MPLIDLDLQILPPENRITASELADQLSNLTLESNCKTRHLVVDVRSESEFNMCRMDGAINYPIENLRDDKLKKLLEEILDGADHVTFICRRGNDSQLAAQLVLDHLRDVNANVKVTDLTGGLHSWSKQVDENFPIY